MSGGPDRETDGFDGIDAPSGAMLSALRAILRPLVRLLLERRVTFPIFAALLKETMIEVVRARLSLAGRRLTDSRVSLLTGIHRKELRRQRSEPAVERRLSAGASLGALVVSRWTHDRRFVSEAGQPLALPRTAPADGGPSFEELVASTSRDTTVRSVLDEWVRQGLVELDAQDVVRLRVESFVPTGDEADKLYFFGRNLRDHAAAGVHNLLDAGEPYFDRSVFYDRLSRESVEELRRLASEVGARALRELGQRALELQRRDAERSDVSTRHRMAWGAYYHAEPEDAEGLGEPPTANEGDGAATGAGEETADA